MIFSFHNNLKGDKILTNSVTEKHCPKAQAVRHTLHPMRLLQASRPPGGTSRDRTAAQKLEQPAPHRPTARSTAETMSYANRKLGTVSIKEESTTKFSAAISYFKKA